MTTERRRSPRIEILGKLHGHSVALNVPVRVTDDADAHIATLP